MLEHYGQNIDVQITKELFLLVAKQAHLYWLRLLTCMSIKFIWIKKTAH